MMMPNKSESRLRNNSNSNARKLVGVQSQSNLKTKRKESAVGAYFSKDLADIRGESARKDTQEDDE